MVQTKGQKILPRAQIDKVKGAGGAIHPSRDSAGKAGGAGLWEVVVGKENEEKGYCRGYSGHYMVKAKEVRL